MGNSQDQTGALPWETKGDEGDQPSVGELEEAEQSAMFADAEVEATVASGQAAATNVPQEATAQPYRVLARKYRPQTFSQLIGQEPMVRTLANAIKRDRLAHAFLMTGVRGVGKTSTARLIAKALNCVGPDGQGGPTIDPCGQCEPCTAIAQGRHIDVIEMDAASHTGVDDVREIIEAVRYAAVSARYKIYIIDEVHMLSRNAFNALLKTLEEPPAHVKFLFATTEVEKLPVTVLSRTQRFDLRRIPTQRLQQHFAWVCAQEEVAAEDDALAMIAAAAEGSVRDGLSILDQAIAHADMDEDALVTAERVRAMLGLADKGAQRRLLGHILEGEAEEVLRAIDQQYALGVEPLALMRGTMDLIHRVTLAQVSDSEAHGASEEERVVLTLWAGRLNAAQLHRLWQLLLKGHDEVRQAPDPLIAAKMALLRVLHAADLPDPGSLAKRLEELAATAASTVSQSEHAPQSTPVAALEWPRLVDQVEQGGNMRSANIMRLQVRVIELADGLLRYSRDLQYRDDIAGTLRDALAKVTGKRWQVIEEQGDGVATLVEREEEDRRADRATMLDDPLVKATFAAFPDAELIEDDRAVEGQSFARRH